MLFYVMVEIKLGEKSRNAGVHPDKPAFTPTFCIFTRVQQLLNREISQSFFLAASSQYLQR